MKKTSIILLSVLTLAALSCSKEVEEAPVNPTYNAEKGEVTTQFVLNIAPGTTPKTKLGADVVQVNNPFRGISAAHILTFELDNDNKNNGEYYIFKPGDDKAVATRDYNLDHLAVAGEISAEQSSRIIELSLPLKTNALAFYALATKPSQGTMTDIEYNNKYGKIATEGTGFNSTVEDIKFSLISRLTDETAFTRFGTLLARIMTGVVKTECKDNRAYAYWWPQDETSKTWKTRVGNIESGNILPADDEDRVAHEGTLVPGSTVDHYQYVTGNSTWKAMGDVYDINHDGNPDNNVNQSPLEEVLGEAYSALITIRVDPNDATKVELRAGSAASVLKTLRDLNDVLSRVINATATSQAEQVAIETAKEIRYRIKQWFGSDDGYKTINWKTIEEVVAAAAEFIPDYATSIAGTAFTQAYLPDNTTLSGGFPINLGLPMSTALLTVVEDPDPTVGKVFEMLDAVPAYGMGGGSVPIADYRYAPEIVYWGNSGIRVNDLAKAKNEYPKTVENWANEAYSAWSGWSNNASVLSTTRSVAMMKQINYGIALLQTNVSYNNLDGTVAYDNNSGIHSGESDTAITIDGTSFKVTGIMIGGVREKIGWDFTPIIDPVNNKPNKIIYDHLSEGGLAIPASGNTTFYTTTWDNYSPQLDNTGAKVGDGRQQDQTDVYIALELVNNTGKDLWGELNIIRNGGTFYLVGKLNLTAALEGNTVTFPAKKYCHYPPYDASGNTIEVKRVFMQDYMTVANVHFTRNSLKHAYVTVPDLRSSQISLGLNIDLTWNPGLSFSVDL